MSTAERIAPVALRPEMATLSMGSLNFGDEVFLNLPPDIEAFARAIEAAGAKPELEIFDAGMMATAIVPRLSCAGPIPATVQLAPAGSCDTRYISASAGEAAVSYTHLV